MPGFSNPVFGGNTLIRPAIQSPNYAAGSAGWSIKRDGSAEFNSVTVRGTLAVGTTIAPGVAIPGGQVTGTVPTASSSGTVTGSIGAGVAVPASQLDATQIPTTTTINGGSITTGIVDAARIAARSLTADKVVIGDTSNILLDPDFSQNSPAWNFSASVIRLASTDPTVPAGAPAPFVTRLVNSTTANVDLAWKHTTFTPNFLMPVSPGETYYVEAWVCASADSNANLRFFLRTTDAVGGTATFPSAASTTSAAAQSWIKISGQITIPAGKFRAAFGIGSTQTTPTTAAGSWFVTNTRMRKAVEGSLVVNGGITAQQIDATNLNVAAANITGQLTAAQIAATAIDGKTITGALVRSAATGNRVEISSTTRGTQTVGEARFYTEVSTDAYGGITAFGPADGTLRSLNGTAPAASGAVAPFWKLGYEDTGGGRFDVGADTTYVAKLHASGDVIVTGTITAANTTTTTGCTPATGFTLVTFRGKRFGSVVTVVVQLSYTGATITANTAGNIGDTLAATLPAGWAPLDNALIGSYDKGGLADGSVTIGTDGACTLKTLSPTATIAAGDSVSFAMTFVQ